MTDTLFPYTTLFRSDLVEEVGGEMEASGGSRRRAGRLRVHSLVALVGDLAGRDVGRQRHLASLGHDGIRRARERSEEHTSELQSLMRISYAVFCLKKKTIPHTHNPYHVPNQPT